MNRPGEYETTIVKLKLDSLATKIKDTILSRVPQTVKEKILGKSAADKWEYCCNYGMPMQDSSSNW